MEASVISYKFEGTKLVVAVDPNKDGQVVLTVGLDLQEVFDEILSLISKPKA